MEYIQLLVVREYTSHYTIEDILNDAIIPIHVPHHELALQIKK